MVVLFRRVRNVGLANFIVFSSKKNSLPHQPFIAEIYIACTYAEINEENNNNN